MQNVCAFTISFLRKHAPLLLLLLCICECHANVRSADLRRDCEEPHAGGAHSGEYDDATARVDFLPWVRANQTWNQYKKAVPPTLYAPSFSHSARPPFVPCINFSLSAWPPISPICHATHFYPTTQFSRTSDQPNFSHISPPDLSDGARSIGWMVQSERVETSGGGGRESRRNTCAFLTCFASLLC